MYNTIEELIENLPTPGENSDQLYQIKPSDNIELFKLDKTKLPPHLRSLQNNQLT